MKTMDMLLLTVGGSHEPILKALAERRPERVIFFCTDKDPGTGRAGSCEQITGKDLVIKAHPEDPRPTLPNIPTQAGLADDAFELIEVPADDLDGAFVAMRRTLERLRAENGAP